jgi:hypothetical protein
VRGLYNEHAENGPEGETTVQAYPVRIEDGVIRSLDGTPLPRRANALLVVLPEAGEPAADAEWLQPFSDYLEALRQHEASTLDRLSDDELIQMVHSSRR